MSRPLSEQDGVLELEHGGLASATHGPAPRTVFLATYRAGDRGCLSSTGVTLTHADAIRVAAMLLAEVHRQDPLRGDLGKVVHDLRAEAVR